MNERIMQLAEEAAQQASDKNMSLEVTTGEDTYQVPAGFIEKFAELIVRECAGLVDGFEITQEVALDEYVDYEAGAVLKEHFGVEE